MNFQIAFDLLKQTFQEWNEDKAPRLGAALAYYTVFSIAPLLVILIAIAGMFFGAEAARGQISTQIDQVVGSQAAQFIEQMIESARKPSDSIFATVVGLGTLILGAMGVFGQLQDALNTIWEVQPKPGQGFFQTVKARLTPFMMVIGVAFLLLSSLAVSALIAAIGTWMKSWLPLPAMVLQTINLLIGFVIITLMFALIFKVLPDVQIQWHDVWIGAAMTTVLFMLGQLGLGWYVGKISAGSTYGAAGSLVAVLMWVYWTSQILFFGAEFTQVYANKFGSKILPSPNAIPVTAETRAQQGLSVRSSKIVSTPNVGDDKAPEFHNILASQRREQEYDGALRENQKMRAKNELLEDIGAILAGVGIILILKRFFGRKENSS